MDSSEAEGQRADLDAHSRRIVVLMGRKAALNAAAVPFPQPIHAEPDSLLGRTLRQLEGQCQDRVAAHRTVKR